MTNKEVHLIKIIQKRILSVLCVFYFPFLLHAEAPDTSYVLLYQDEFNSGVLNTNDWEFRDNNNLYHGGYNQKENVSVETKDDVGYLRIDYNMWDVNGDGIDDKVGGGVISVKPFGYGYYEARMKFYDGSKGFHQSFWTYGIAANGGQWSELYKNDKMPSRYQLVEIDGIEYDSDYNAGGANFHLWKPTPRWDPPGKHKSFDRSYMPKEKWITIGFEWKPGEIIWYVDGVRRHRLIWDQDRYGPQNVWFTGLANTTNWFGSGGTPLPDAHFKVDYFRFYSAPVTGNILGNHSFEDNDASSATEVPTAWIADDGVYNNAWKDAVKTIGYGGYDKNCYLKHDHNSTNSRAVTSRQELEWIPNGQYKLTAWVKSSGGMTTAKMFASNFGQGELKVNLPTTNTWTQITIDSINVTNNICHVGFSTSGGVGNWICVDKVELVNKAQGSIKTEIIVENGGPGYEEAGSDWFQSSLNGYQESASRYSDASNAYATWTPNIPLAGFYEVSIYKIVHAGSDTKAKIDVVYDGSADTQILNYASGNSGWVKLGVYEFAEGKTGYVRNSFSGLVGKYLRSSAVKFKMLAVELDSIAIDLKSIQLNKGTSKQLKISFFPESISGAETNWTSENESIATVDANGLVEAIDVGTTEIIASNTASGKIDTCLVTVTSATSTQSVIRETINVFPNPVKDKLFLSKNDDFETINIFNIQNQLLIHKKIMNNNEVEVSDLPKGMYVFILEGGHKTYTGKIIKR